MQALWRAIHCLNGEHAIAALESAVHRRFVSIEDARRIGRLAPRRLQPDAFDLARGAQSGNETIVRRRLQREGYWVESQAGIPGMGHHDLLVEHCLALEVDGKEWHGEARYEADRARDLHSEGLGRHVLRLSSRQIHLEWQSTLAVIERVVADAVRQRDRRFERTLIRFDDPL
jgi:very-short-patch-repair endonuclease